MKIKEACTNILQTKNKDVLTEQMEDSLCVACCNINILKSITCWDKSGDHTTLLNFVNQ